MITKILILGVNIKVRILYNRMFLALLSAYSTQRLRKRISQNFKISFKFNLGLRYFFPWNLIGFGKMTWGKLLFGSFSGFSMTTSLNVFFTFKFNSLSITKYSLSV